MKRKRILILFVTLVLCILVVSVLLVPSRQSSVVRAAEDKPKGELTKVFRREKKNKDEPLPDWVDQAFKKGKGHLKGGKEWSKGLLDVESELEVQTAEEDDLGQTRVRVGQVFNGVPVIGGQLIIHEDANGVRETDGRGFNAARHVDTNPKLKAKDALDAAKTALGYKGKLANEPEATLAILPGEVMDLKDRTGRANLVYVVELLIEDGTDATARHFYYIDANDGHVITHFDAMMYDNGVGYSQHSGGPNSPVTIQTRLVNGQYYLQDPSRGANGNDDDNTTALDTTTRNIIKQGGIWVTDVTQGCDNTSKCIDYQSPGTQPIGTVFTNTTNVWGDGLPFQRDVNGSGTGGTANRQTAAVDALFSIAQVQDYYANTYGRNGIDGNNYRMLTRVHNGTNATFDFWNGRSIVVGDGIRESNGNGSPLAVPDILGHEYTHGIFEKSVYPSSLFVPDQTGEAIAFNESFSDIMGVAVEFYIDRTLGIHPLSGVDYRIGGAPDMATFSLNHYDKFVARGNAHDNAYIQNKVFWMLAQTNTNTHPYSGIAVTGIGQTKAENVFYRALTEYLPTSDITLFYGARSATLSAASHYYGSASSEYAATKQAWDAVGIHENKIDGARFFVRQQYVDFLSRDPNAACQSNPDCSGSQDAQLVTDRGGWDYWTCNITGGCPTPNNNLTGCGLNQTCVDTERVHVAYAFFISSDSAWTSTRNAGLNGPQGTYTYNAAFVDQCYRTFLRRAPNDPPDNNYDGYNFWLNILNAPLNNGSANTEADYKNIISAFITCPEYRSKFGPV